MRPVLLFTLLCLLSVTAEAREIVLDGTLKVSCSAQTETGCAALAAFLKKNAAGEKVTARVEKELNDAEKKQLADIRARYDKLSKKAKPADISPEIMAAGLCAELRLLAAATSYLDRAATKRPEFAALAAKMKKIADDCSGSDACPIF